MNRWLKVKTESSGYPHWADTLTKKQQYRDAFLERETIRLDPSLIVKNPGRKATAKLMLNSFWGKFGENLRKSSVQQITTTAQLYEVATDSVIYSHREGEPLLAIGDYLGDLTNELSPGDSIVDFTSGGPKNYGYRTREGKVECKVRGFSLGSVRGHAQLNYERLRENVLEELVNPVDDRHVIPVVNPHFFTRDASTKRLRVVPRRKEYGLVFDKRVVDTETFKSYPYGYH